MSKVNCIQADWQQDVSAIAGLNAGGGASDSIATLIKDSFDIITDAEDTISRYDSDGEINSVFDTDSVGKYQLASFPTLTETLHKYSKNAPISIQNDIDLPFNMKLDDFLGAMSNVDIKGYSTAATGSLAKSGNFSTGQSGIVTLKDLLEPATPLGKQLKREYIEFKKQIGDDFTYEEYQMMAMNLASYDYDSFLEALAKGTAAFALTVAVTSIPVIGPIISLGMSGVGALEGFWGAATGNSLLTGRKLSGEEKVLSGLFGAMNLAFAGLTAYNSFFKGKVKIPSKKASGAVNKFKPKKVTLKNGEIAYKAKDGTLVRSPDYLDDIGNIKWPKEQGFVTDANGKAIMTNANVKKGQILDRYGDSGGTFTSPVENGKPLNYDSRGLPYPESTMDYYKYEVVKDINMKNIQQGFDNLSVSDQQMLRKIMKDYGFGLENMANPQSGIISEVFGSGGGTQIKLGTSVSWYEKLGILKEIK